jgi:hypothetical protein
MNLSVRLVCRSGRGRISRPRNRGGHLSRGASFTASGYLDESMVLHEAHMSYRWQTEFISSSVTTGSGTHFGVWYINIIKSQRKSRAEGSGTDRRDRIHVGVR